MLRTKKVMLESDYAEKMADRKLSADGSTLLPDSTPMAPPLGYIKQPSITERIRDMVRSEHLRRAAEAAGAETFEEANDFDIGDDYDPSSPYEDEFDPANPDADHVSTGVPSPGGGEGAGGPSDRATAPVPPAVAPGDASGAAPAGGPPRAS